MKEIRTEIEIDAPAERVWEVLTDFDAYPQWNPVIKRVSGSLSEGAEMEMLVCPFGAQTVKIRPTLLKVDPCRELRWKARLTPPGLFEGEHAFVLRNNDGRGVLFVQSESFRGALVPVVSALLDKHTREGFQAMNRALKERVEKSITRSPETRPMQL